MLVVDLDWQARGHLHRALEAHALWCRAQAIPFPQALIELSRAVSRGQERPKVAPPAPVLHCHGVLVDYAEAAVRLGVSSRTVRRWVDQGRLEAKRIGRTRRIHVDELARFSRLEEHPR